MEVQFSGYASVSASKFSSQDMLVSVLQSSGKLNDVLLADPEAFKEYRVSCLWVHSGWQAGSTI